MLAHWYDVGPVVVDGGEMGGTRRRPGDAAGAATLGLSRYRPRSGKVALRGVGAILRVERVDSWDGET
jgi:hypothetical protein